MKIRKVRHMNWIGHEINESLRFGYPRSDREIYCKKLHKITEPLKKDCDSCAYFAGWMMGHGLECDWDDVSEDESQERHIPHEDVRKEMMRVSELIKKGILKMG
ncbi:hypothetical protein [Mitsuokella multacida]|jgi:hypothetical protein